MSTTITHRTVYLQPEITSTTIRRLEWISGEFATVKSPPQRRLDIKFAHVILRFVIINLKQVIYILYADLERFKFHVEIERTQAV